MITNKIISSKDLLKLLTVESVEKAIYQKAEILQIAICDYPGPVQEPIDYLNILENEVGKPLTLERIIKFQSKIDLKTDAWKAESLSVISHLFNDDKSVELNNIVEELSSYYFTNVNTFGSL